MLSAREFIQTDSFEMASEESSDDCQNGWKDSPKILIIGAGISGIAAGNYLTSAGFTDFKILEAADRIGGRIWSIDLETDNVVKAELGANWIHGIDKNPIYKIAVQHNLLDEPIKGRGLGDSLKFVKEDGSPVNTKIVEEVDWTYGMLMSQVEEFYQSHIPTPVENDSVGAFIERGFNMKMKQKHRQGEDKKIRRMILDQRMLGEAVINGCHDLFDLSLSEVGSFEELPGVHYVIKPGFETVVHLLAQNIPSEKVLLEHPVTQINWDQTAKEAREYEVCVECQNGKKFYANHVLVTCSLGYLKKCAGRLFNPQLPDFKLNPINNLTMGTVNKIILEFESKVLPQNISRLEVIWDRMDIETSNSSDTWVKKIGSFDAIAETVLVGWLSGKEAEFIETLSDEEIGEKCVETIKSLLKTHSIPKLKRVVVSRWRSSPYICGSYSFIPIGATAEDIETMGEPVTDSNEKPVLLFAGEATHTTFYSSSHGALLSGQREAQRIIDLYRQ